MSNISHSVESSDGGFYAQAHPLVAHSSADRRCRGILTTMVGIAVLWLLVTVTLSGLSALKLQWPAVLDYSFLSFGRIFPLIEMLTVYGSSLSGVSALTIWVLSRDASDTFASRNSSFLGLVIWNLALIAGCIATLAGYGGPLRGLVFPVPIHIIMLVGIAMVIGPSVISAVGRRGALSCGLLYILGGWVWFVWSNIVSHPLITATNVKGIMEALVASWCHHSVIWGSLVPAAIGIIYCVVGVLMPKGVYSGGLARGSFLPYFFCVGMSYTASFPGPIPLWLVSLGGFSSVLLLIPATLNAFNIWMSLGSEDTVEQARSTLFIKLSCACLVVVCVLKAVFGLHFGRNLVGLSGGSLAVDEAVLNCFVLSAVFSGVYIMMPRLARCEWLSRSLFNVHFFANCYALIGWSAFGVCASLLAGADMADADSLFSDVSQCYKFFAIGKLFCLAIWVLGLLAFAFHFLLIASGIGQPEGDI
ncbi:MAG: hypothetical protein RLZZ399_517 [Verrucomicrobiota bacterium]|jgi:cytochrome c oxidase cbb3-type subunit 1